MRVFLYIILIFSLENFSQSFPSLYIIKFNSNIKGEWLKEIEKIEGIKRVYSAYFKENSLLYEIKSLKDYEKALSLPFIKEIKKYLPENKTKINLIEREGKIKVRIKLLRDSNYEKIIKILEGKRAEILKIVMPVHWLETPFLVAELKSSVLYDILKEEEVLWVEEIKSVQPTLETAREIIQTGTGDGCSGNINEVPIWSSGITGAGPSPSCNSNKGTEQIIGIIDTSFFSPDLDCPSGVPNCSIFKNIIYNSSTNPPCNIENSVSFCEGGYGHGTATAGIILGNGSQSGGENPVEQCSIKGISFGARLWALKCDSSSVIFDCFNNCNGGDYLQLLRDFFLSSFNDGSRLSSHSWTSYVNGEYDSGAEFVDIWSYDNDNNPENGLKQEYLWFFSTGNTGPSLNSIGSPATAKNDLSVGAYYNGIDGVCFNPDTPPCDENKLVCYSSRGSTDDGRYGTEVAGPTQFLTVPADTSGYVLFGGTSASTPALAGTAALIRDWLVNHQNVSNPSGTLIKALILNSTEYILEPSENLPGTGQGWGRPVLSNICDDFSLQNCNQLRSLWFEGVFSETGEAAGINISVLSNLKPLKCTLTWFDPPNLIGGGALINNLNLKVTAPDNTVYLGNDFNGQWSNTGGTFDSINNTEGVRIQNPQVGLWKIEVFAENIPQSPQPFSLVCSGNIGSFKNPKPIPNGSGSSLPLKVSKISNDGSIIKVSWDNQCTPKNTNIIYGPLSNISNYQITGSKCAIQNPESWSISDTDIWFLLLTDEGGGIESSWGISSSGQRNGNKPSNQCGNFSRNNNESCP